MKNINLKQIKEVDDLILGIYDNYMLNVDRQISEASKRDLIECADAFDAGEACEEIAGVIFGKEDLKDMQDEAYDIALERFEQL